MKRNVIRRNEMIGATLELGGTPITLDEYATTGLVSIAIGPRGHGKTNAGLLMAEQLSMQGWISVLIDAEAELESLYGDAVESPVALSDALRRREQPILVVNARDASEFVPFGRAILEAADEHRKPIFVAIDEGQLFSASRRRTNGMGEAADIINELAERGRKRALDMFITALRFTGTLQRTLFANRNLTLIGWQEDPTVWSALGPLFKASKIEFADLNGLGPGEFFCLSRHGIEKIRMPMADALRAVAPKAKRVVRTLPTTFNEWTKAMEGIATERLMALDDDVVALLGTIGELPTQQLMAGRAALQDERDARA
jgi:hypothetical protein